MAQPKSPEGKNPGQPEPILTPKGRARRLFGIGGAGFVVGKAAEAALGPEVVLAQTQREEFIPRTSYVLTTGALTMLRDKLIVNDTTLPAKVKIDQFPYPEDDLPLKEVGVEAYELNPQRRLIAVTLPIDILLASGEPTRVHAWMHKSKPGQDIDYGHSALDQVFEMDDFLAVYNEHHAQTGSLNTVLYLNEGAIDYGHRVPPLNILEVDPDFQAGKKYNLSFYFRQHYSPLKKASDGFVRAHRLASELGTPLISLAFERK